MAAALVAISFLLGKRVKNRVKDSPYESGMAPTGSARERFSVKFYLVAIVFILFDIEAVFLYPWAVVYRELKMFGFVEMLLFVALVLVGFFYVWKKGALDWSSERRTQSARPEESECVKTSTCCLIILKDHAVAAALEARFPEAVTGGHAERDEPTLLIAPASIVEVCRFLKDEQVSFG